MHTLKLLVKSFRLFQLPKINDNEMTILCGYRAQHVYNFSVLYAHVGQFTDKLELS